MRHSVISFRHVENKLLIPTIISLLLLMASINLSLRTLNGWVIAIVILIPAILISAIIFIALYKKYRNNIGGIIGGKKRLVKYSINVAFCLYSLLCFTLLTTNRYLASNEIEYIDATIIEACPSVYKGLGPTLDIAIDGDLYYQIVNEKLYYNVHKSKNVIIGLKHGYWGLNFIVTAQKK